jgi:amino-acid N-acetyltransferase
MAAFDVANRVMTLLSENKSDAVLGNWVKARGLGIINGIDYQCAGQVENLKIDIINSILDEGLIPIFPNIGWSTGGRPYNLNSNELAVYLSIQLKAEKLFFITSFEPDISGTSHSIPKHLVRGAKTKPISQLKSDDAFEISRLNRNDGGDLIQLLEQAARACDAGVSRVHIVAGSREGVVLKEVFSSRGLGLMIYRDEHTFIRPMLSADIPEVLRIMRPMVDKNILVPRTPRVLEAKTADYVVYEVDGIIHACGALHMHNTTSGEIAAICVDQTYSGLGIGKQLVRYLLKKARDDALKQVFVLTTQAEDWFTELGFKPGSVKDLPLSKQSDYNASRASKPLFYKPEK